jgi:hypothetical protein
MGKSQVFDAELNLIKDDNVREFTKRMLEELPDYFYEVSASSSFKYHPSFAREKGGLVAHTRAAVRLAHEMFRCEMFGGKYSDLEKDMITSALILHDGCKSGIVQQKFSIATHPLEVVKFCEQKDDIKNLIPQEVFEGIMDLIRTHMGAYNTDYKTGKEVLPLPKTVAQRFVFMMDYIVSRQCITHDFDAPLSKNY